MKENLPYCPLCTRKIHMKIYEPNVAFYICKGAKNKKHKADLLESIKIANSTSTEQKSVSS